MADQWWLIAGSDSYQVNYLPNERHGMQLDGIGMPPIEHVKQRSPRQNGSTRVATVLNERVIDVGFMVMCSSRQEYWETRFEIAEMLKRFDDLILRFILDSGESYDIDVACLAETSRKVQPHSLYIAVRLEAANPIFRATNISTLTVGVPQIAGAFKFPLTFPIVFGASAINRDIALTYGGSWPAYPQIDIRGPIQNPAVQNNTTGEELSLTATIDDGDVVRIDLNPQGKSVWHVTDDVNWMNYLDSDSDLATWHLEPTPDAAGGINDLHFQGLNGGDNTAITLRWYDQFIALGRRA